MDKVNNERNNYEDLAKLLEEYGDLRTVHISKNGFLISDLYLNGDGELRLDCYEEITSKELADEFFHDNAYTSCVHPLFKSWKEIRKDKCEALEGVVSWKDMYVYKPTDNSFMEHADYVLKYVDFSKLSTYGYEEGVIKFLETDKTLGINEFHFICRDNRSKDYIKKILLEYGDIKYVYRDAKENIYIKNLFLDENGEPTLECSSAFTGKMFEGRFKEALYTYIGEESDFLEMLYELSPNVVEELKLNALEDVEDRILFTSYASNNTKFYELINYFFSKVNVNELDLFNPVQGILDFIESSKKETFFIVKF